MPIPEHDGEFFSVTRNRDFMGSTIRGKSLNRTQDRTDESWYQNSAKYGHKLHHGEVDRVDRLLYGKNNLRSGNRSSSMKRSNYDDPYGSFVKNKGRYPAYHTYEHDDDFERMTSFPLAEYNFLLLKKQRL